MLEVIVAMSIMAAGFITVLSLFSEGVRSLGFTDQYLKGVTLASNKMNELELANFNISSFSGTFDKEEKYRWELTITPYDSTLNNEKENIFLVKVGMKVLWEDMGREKNVELVTLKTLGKNSSVTDIDFLKINTLPAEKIAPPPPDAGHVSGAITPTPASISGGLTQPSGLSGASTPPGALAPSSPPVTPAATPPAQPPATPPAPPATTPPAAPPVTPPAPAVTLPASCSTMFTISGVPTTFVSVSGAVTACSSLIASSPLK